MVAQQITPGAEVYTSDGDRLGQVVEVRGEAFKVDVPMMPDYWLLLACVESADSAAVRLECTKDQVGDHKIEEPEAA